MHIYGSAGVYVIVAQPSGIHKTALRVQITYTLESHGTADLYHSAPLIVNYVFTVYIRHLTACCDEPIQNTWYLGLYYSVHMTAVIRQEQ